MPGLFQAEGIVLKSRDYQETDQLLTILTRTHGKLEAIVKGVRKPRSSLRSGTQQLCRSRFLFYAGKSLATVTQCEVQEIYGPLRQDLKRLAYAYYLVEIADGVVMPGQVNQAMYLLLQQGLEALGELEPALVARAFEARTLKLLGLAPRLEACALCQRELKGNGRVAIAPAAGGALCPECRGHQGREYLVSRGGVKTWQQLNRLNWSYLKRLQINPMLMGELGEVMPAFLEYYLDRRLRSRAFINEIGGDNIDGPGKNRPVAQAPGT
ncbi:DNA repair protein RecO [Moorella thermoacetica]|uniref:DNA repair protein RecO n=1 Tax=Moorella thermoacetica (strain ATCC 39073 / JCM 9320) TaxID=264732 RepID=RECO_MOOTA|nr:DNA repair protein RecO [Moorella thermoacetica]Q2RKV8.1 RecName: Full=DNA repair protein RecO; AltName: Full=Recombination protein O [Moorella thermoacetica ATCC 39073]AKX93357.1 DNA repair protein RecO [Moorella thermoacetica]AKX95999.1 DNA repair protein RecO [Moorella thermoacetica]OIQ56085.1 DNA repair protein RecO [Moorella thermoacetica]QCZ99809.1 DNA repair protein RecO [Moorella thermoacetica]TYL08267.1 DNA repair protein RecO [Moorella thermoacetica]